MNFKNLINQRKPCTNKKIFALCNSMNEVINHKISKRAEAITESITMKITALAKQLKAEGEDVIGFGAGEPDFGTPTHISQAGIDAILTGKTTYTPASGIPELKEAISSFESQFLNIDIKANNVVVSCGGKHAIMNVCLALLDAGDEVIIPSPYWVSYPEQVKLCGASPIFVNCLEENHFCLTAKDFEASITPKTKLLILNSPSNPTGMLYTKDNLEALLAIAKKHNIYVLSDEIYAQLIYDGLSHQSIASLDGINEHVILVSGVAKSYAMTGWRIGYSICHPNLAKQIASLQSHMTSNPSTPAQWAALEAIQSDQSSIIEMRKIFEARRNNMCKLLNKMPYITCLKPQGAFYTFPNISNTFGKKTKLGASINNSVDFCEHLLAEAKIACVPGAGFGSDPFMRLSYATSDQLIETGLKRLHQWLQDLH